MTSKRKTILKAIVSYGIAGMDDLELSTGLPRKNLQDNLKATVDAGLIERLRDDVTGLPAYKLTKTGRTWLENDKDDSSSKPAAKTLSVTPAGGGDISPAARASDHLPEVAEPDEGAAATEPPTLDKMPAAARSGEKLTALDIAVRNHNLLQEIAAEVALPDEAKMDSLPQLIRARLAMLPDEGEPQSDFRRLDIDLAWQIASLENEARRKQETIDLMADSVVRFCWLTARMTESQRHPLNLHECEQLLADKLKRLQSKAMAMQAALDAAQTVIADEQLAKQILSAEIGRLRGENKALTFTSDTLLLGELGVLPKDRYLVADSYVMFDDRREAQRAAMQNALDSGATVVLASINGAEQVAINPVWEPA